MVEKKYFNYLDLGLRWGYRITNPSAAIKGAKNRIYNLQRRGLQVKPKKISYNSAMFSAEQVLEIENFYENSLMRARSA